MVRSEGGVQIWSLTLCWLDTRCAWGRGGGDPRLVDRAGVQAEHRWVQTGGRVTEVRFFNPQKRGAVLALLALAVVAALVAHEQHGDEEDAEDGEGVKEDKVEEGVVGAHHRLEGGHCWQRTDNGSFSTEEEEVRGEGLNKLNHWTICVCVCVCVPHSFTCAMIFQHTPVNKSVWHL